MKLDVKAFAVAVSLVWGLGLFFLTWWMLIFGTAEPGEQTIIGRIYLGYTVSGAGAMIGLVWGLVDGLIGGAVFAWLYNVLVSRTSADAGESRGGGGTSGGAARRGGGRKKRSTRRGSSA